MKIDDEPESRRLGRELHDALRRARPHLEFRRTRPKNLLEMFAVLEARHVLDLRSLIGRREYDVTDADLVFRLSVRLEQVSGLKHPPDDLLRSFGRTRCELESRSEHCREV